MPRNSYFPSVVAFAYVYIRHIDWRIFLSVSRMEKAELNRSAATCSIKVKFEANHHKSGSILCRCCASIFFFPELSNNQNSDTKNMAVKHRDKSAMFYLDITRA